MADKEVWSSSFEREMETGDAQCRPYTTDTAGHVGNISDEKTVGEGFLCFKTNRITALGRGGDLVGEVRAEVDLSVGNLDETLGSGGSLIYVVDKAGCGITILIVRRLGSELVSKGVGGMKFESCWIREQLPV